MASARRECMILVMLPCRVLNVWCSSVLMKSRRDLSVPCAVRGFRATVPVSQSVIFRGLARSLTTPPSLSTAPAAPSPVATPNSKGKQKEYTRKDSKYSLSRLVGYSIIAVRSFALLDHPDSESGARRNSGGSLRARCARRCDLLGGIFVNGSCKFPMVLYLSTRSFSSSTQKAPACPGAVVPWGDREETELN